MGNRLQLPAATPVFVGRVSLLLGYRAGELGRAGHGRMWWYVASLYRKCPEGRPAGRSHEMEVEE